ncbi:MAG: hypothetical protein KDA60_12980, partial [Planctomycetales bacterium]|nr:hypothetical protein [Planctomycetales bacterium]
MLANYSTQPLGSYLPKVYTTDGGFSMFGLTLSTAVGVSVACVIGLLFGVLGQYFYVILAFPVLIGLAVGGTQVFAIKKTKTRSVFASGAAGLAAGTVAVVSMHYVDFVVFQRAMATNEQHEQMLQEALDETEDNEERQILTQMLTDYRNDADVIAAKNATTLLSYVDYAAKEGVELTASRHGTTPINLGYAGTYIYWGIEALIIAAITATMARKRSAEPFCQTCDEWCVERELGSLQAS